MFFNIPQKKKISKKIVEIIKQNFGTDKPIYDIFGGGGAITAGIRTNRGFLYRVVPAG